MSTRGPSTPPPRRDISHTSDLSPSKWNAYTRDSPLQTSPTKKVSPQRRWGKQVPPLPGLENAHLFQKDHHQDQFPRAHFPNPSSIYSSTDPISYPPYSQSPIHHPFPQVSSNVGRRRANAISLIDTPARRSHSREMAKIFEEARETIKYQDQIRQRTRLPGSYVSPPPRPQNLPTWRQMRDEKRQNARPLPRLPANEFPSIPEFPPISRLSSDIPLRLRAKPSLSATKSSRASNSIGTDDLFVQKHRQATLDQLTSGHSRENRTSADSGIAMAYSKYPAPVHAMRNDPFSKQPGRVLPDPQSVLGLNPAHFSITQWLEQISFDAEQPCEGGLLESSSDARLNMLANMAHKPTVPLQKLEPTSAVQGVRPLIHSSTANQFDSSIPWRSNVTASDKSDRLEAPSTQTLAAPARHELRRRSKESSDRTSSSASFLCIGVPRLARHTRASSSASGSSKERQGYQPLPSPVLSNGNVSEDAALLAPLVRPETPSHEATSTAEEDVVAPLTPDVQIHRKGQGPARRRCPSYFDRDILL